MNTSQNAVILSKHFRTWRYDHGTSIAGNVALVLLDNLSGTKWPLRISFPHYVLARVSWLPPSKVSFSMIQYYNVEIRITIYLVIYLSRNILNISHYRFHTSYGWLTFWDWFYGTDIEFQKTEVMKERHFRIHSTQSAREMYPDLKPKSL